MKALGIEEFLEKARTIPVIDVRSPAEYARARIPGAVNIPLFDDDQRASVGTTYKQIGKDQAVLLGLEFVGPKLVDFVQRAWALDPQCSEVLVHCWRGGMRSGSFGWLLNTAGMQVATLAGGYKAYRTHILSAFEEPRKLVVLGGKTGSGKTEILKELAQQGQQVIDLEALAQHKGSSYGAIGQLPQPTTEHFENLIYEKWAGFDAQKTIWVEDESRLVGHCYVPMPLWEQMSHAPMVFVDVPKEIRIGRLVREYGGQNHQLLCEATERIKKRLGGQNYQAALTALAAHDYAQVSNITLDYYDKAYLHGLAQRPAERVSTIAVADDNPGATAQKLIDWLGS